jgi:nicotinamide phosphoribosyltransferase
MKMNPLTSIDFYKADHISQYPEGTEYVYSNFTPRSAKLTNLGKDFDGKIVFFGLQGFIKWFLIDLWNDEFFNKPKYEVVAKYKRRMDNSLGPDAVDVSHIENLHDLGYLPLKIKALPEGSLVPMQVPVLTVINTHTEFSWLVNYLESVMSAELWKSCVTATTAYEYKKILTKAAIETGAPLDFVPLQGHDFAFRGAGGVYDAAKNQAGHLLSFIGTDTVPAIDYLEDYYGANSDLEAVGVSVPATEHSVMCMGGIEDEIGTFERLICELYPTGIVSIVSDTWDFWKVITQYLPELKDKIMARQPNALGLNKVVIRPDSGDPVEIICGIEVRTLRGDFDELDRWKEYVADDLDDIFRNELDAEEPHYEETGFYRFGETVYEVTYEPDLNRHDKTYYFVDNCRDDIHYCTFTEVVLTAEQKGAVECLWDTFGGTLTDKGYKVLDEHIGLIYGDSITIERAKQIMSRLKDKGFASCNVVLGIGSYTYQYVTRDTYGFAMKATWGMVNGEAREIFKDPKTDSGVKKSARGLLRVDKEDGEYILEDRVSGKEEDCGDLKMVFRDGTLYREQTLSEIRGVLNE